MSLFLSGKFIKIEQIFSQKFRYFCNKNKNLFYTWYV